MQVPPRHFVVPVQLAQSALVHSSPPLPVGSESPGGLVMGLCPPLGLEGMLDHCCTGAAEHLVKH
eukprot:11193908-Lingulodinium_polyedra.AAC.1